MKICIIFTIYVLAMSACSLSPQPSPYPKIADSKSMRFTGEVSRDQLFEQEISETLVFRLIPQTFDGEGWLIWVGEKGYPDNDFGRYITPPYYGENSRFIDVWFFEPKGMDKVTFFEYQKRGSLNFVLNQRDFKIASETLSKILKPENYSPDEVELAKQKREQLKLASGILTITAMELRDRKPEGYALFEHIKFEVELSGLDTQ